MPDHKGKIVNRWMVQPLRELEADVPLPFVVRGTSESQTAAQLNVGQTVTIDSTGLVRNASGTAIFRLEQA